MKLTRHNGRSGKHGTYNPKHNDRTFDVSNSEHIDEERAKHNVYWDCFNGYRTFAEKQVQSELADTFEEVEELFYSAKYGAYVEAQNARNDKNRHSERNRTTTDLLKDKRTCPEETIYQIGKMGDHVPPDVLLKVVTDFFVEMERRFGSHVHILDWALHLDEATPHIQERHVFDCENKYGEICPQQEKALEELGFELPDPTKKQGRHNNRKMTFDSACRAMLFDIAKKHGLHLEQEPEYGGRAYLEKQDFILAKQKEQMEAQEQKLEELTLKIEDVETLIDDVADIAYDKAVEVVTDTVRVETHKEDIRLIEETKIWLQSPERKAPKKEQMEAQEQKLEELTLKIEDVETLIDDVADIAYDKAVEVVTDTVRVETHKEDIRLIEETKIWLQSPERKAPKKERDYAISRLDGVIGKIKNAMQSALDKIKSALLSPEVKKTSKEQIKEKVKPSILARLERNKELAKQENEARRSEHRPHKKQNMEL